MLDETREGGRQTGSALRCGRGDGSAAQEQGGWPRAVGGEGRTGERKRGELGSEEEEETPPTGEARKDMPSKGRRAKMQFWERAWFIQKRLGPWAYMNDKYNSGINTIQRTQEYIQP